MLVPTRLSVRCAALSSLAAATLAILAACGGGSGSESSSTPATGKVSILMTDGPTDAFCQVLATVESIDLFGGSGAAVNVFTGPETVDVLAMRNYADFFAIDPTVPVGRYSKVRMTLSDLALVECPEPGSPEPEADWEHPSLPGNGKLDLNPRGGFEVVGGESMLIELDLDMQKSLHLHQTGQGKWQFRPVVFVTIRPDDTKLVRVFGRVQNLGTSTFELCPLEPASSVDEGQDTPAAECVDVFPGDATIFDETGTPAAAGAIGNGALLTAIGFLGLHDDLDGDSRADDLKLDARVVELGPQDAFERIAGTVVSALGGNDLFEFDGTPLDDANDAIDVLWQQGTRIFALGSNEELTFTALQPGVTGEVDGVFNDPSTEGEPLKSALIVLDQDATPEIAWRDAQIQSIDNSVPATPRLAVDVTVDAVLLTNQCVTTDAGTRYLRITESANTSETAEIAPADLAVGNVVDVFGGDDASAPGCVLADAIQSYVSGP